jgi:hypothetical protein
VALKQKRSPTPNKNSSTLNYSPLPLPRPDTSSVSEMLTPSEIEQLRQEMKELADYNPKAFAHLKKK